MTSSKRSGGRQPELGVVVAVVLALGLCMSVEQDIGQIAPVNQVDRVAVRSRILTWHERASSNAIDPHAAAAADVGVCAICGYDIHDNPGGRCTECGAAPKDGGVGS